MFSSTVAAQAVPLTVVALVGLVAAVIDIRVFKVHNLLTIPLVISGLLYHSVESGTSGIGYSLGGLLVGFASLIVFYAAGGVGAGDVKLMAGVGAWLGPWLTVNVLMIAGIAAGVYSLVLILKSGGVRHVMANVAILVYRMRALAVHFGHEERVENVVADIHGDRRHRLVPFAAMVLTGIVAVLFGVNSLLLP